jgi:macrodomain Ter protein organizer (MatP/YcbG family)
MTERDAKKKKAFVVTERQIRMLSGRGRKLGLGLSEYLRRLLDDANVIEAMDKMEAASQESPDDYLRRVAEGRL